MTVDMAATAGTETGLNWLEVIKLHTLAAGASEKRYWPSVVDLIFKHFRVLIWRINSETSDSYGLPSNKSFAHREPLAGSPGRPRRRTSMRAVL